ncbi:hypothetical protein PCASD_00191 [Puccinia coronata f. sp. avenae]|uniref:Uncharacterized protein n=1 Tax=Puccinia coronata f. sp. avenae TaxID=200324 RepID=A0A2N5VQX3_9BASI|nr:hypothetical protein PCASD_00191 [Puccinia coronata f. sp. avenae]
MFDLLSYLQRQWAAKLVGKALVGLARSKKVDPRCVRGPSFTSEMIPVPPPNSKYLTDSHDLATALTALNLPPSSAHRNATSLNAMMEYENMIASLNDGAEGRHDPAGSWQYGRPTVRMLVSHSFPQELVSRKRVLRPSSAELAGEPCGICAGDPFETFQLDEEEVDLELLDVKYRWSSLFPLKFTAILKAFKSFADSIHFHPLPNRLKLSAVSPTRSAHAVAVFERTFFDAYLLSNPTLGLIEVPLKSFHKIFAQANLISPLDSCKITIDSDDSNVAQSMPRGGAVPSGLHGGVAQTGIIHRLNHRLTIELKSGVGIVRSFSLPYSSSRTLNPVELRANNSPNTWLCLASHLKQWLDHFVANPNVTQNLAGAMEGVEDVCFCYLPNHQITLKTVNLASDSDQNVVVPRKQDIFTKGIMTNMSMKEVRAIVEVGSVLGSGVDAGFSQGGRPVYFSLLNQEGSAGLEFVLASTDGTEMHALPDHPLNNNNNNNNNNNKQPRPPPPVAAALRPPHNHHLPPKDKQPAPSSRRPDSSSGSSRPTNEPSSRQKGKQRASPDSSRVDSSASRSMSNPAGARQQPINNPGAKDGRGGQPVKLFKPADHSLEEPDDDEDDDELDRIPATTWDHVEQQAFALSQSRKRQRLHSLSHSATPDHLHAPAPAADDDEQLLPSQAPGHSNEQPHWKLFFD